MSIAKESVRAAYEARRRKASVGRTRSDVAQRDAKRRWDERVMEERTKKAVENRKYVHYTPDEYKKDADAVSKGAEGYKRYESDLLSAQSKADEANKNKTFWDTLGESILQAAMIKEASGSATSDPFSIQMNTTTHLNRTNKGKKDGPSDNWSDEQKNIFGYLYSISPDTAYSYAASENRRMSDFEKRKQLELDTKGYYKRHKEGAWGNTGLNLESIGYQFLAGFEGLTNVLNGVFGLEVEENPYFSTRAQAMRDAVSEDMDGWGKFLYQTGMSMADSAVATGVGMLFAPLGPAAVQGVSLTLMSSQAAGAAMSEAKKKGYTDTEAAWLGIIAGGIEVATEKMGLDALFDNSVFKNAGKSFFSKAATYIGENALSEGLEETFAEAGNVIAEGAFAAVTGNSDKTDFVKRVLAYMENGENEGAATGHAVVDVVGDSLLAGLGGMLSGVGFGTVGGSVNTVVQNNLDTKAGRAIIERDNAKGLLLNAANASEKAELMKLAEKAKSAKAGTNKEARLTGETARAVAEEAKNQKESYLTLEEVRHLGGETAVAEYNKNPTKFEQAVEALNKKQYEASVTENARAAVARGALKDGGWLLPNERYDGEVLKAYSAGIKSYKGLASAREIALEMAEARGISTDGKSFSEIVAAFTPEEQYELLELNDTGYAYAFKKAHDMGIRSRGKSLATMLEELPAAERDALLDLSDDTLEAAFSAGAEVTRAAVARQAEIDRKIAKEREKSGDSGDKSSEGRKKDKNKKKNPSNFKIEDSVNEASLTVTQREDVKILRRVAEFVPGIDFVITNKGVDSKGNYNAKRNGYYSDGEKTVYVDISAGRKSIASAVDFAIAFAGAHEVVHAIRANAPAYFEELSTFVIDTYYPGKTLDLVVRMRMQEYQERENELAKADGREPKKITYGYALEEVMANALEGMFKSERVMFKLAKGHRRLFSRIWQYIRDFFNRVIRKIGQYSNRTVESRILNETHKSQRKLEDLFVKALRAASDGATATRNESASSQTTENNKKTTVTNTNEDSVHVRRSIKYPVFTSEDIAANMEVIADMEAVATIEASKLEKTGKSPRTIFEEFFASVGNSIYSDVYGDISLGKSSAKSEIRHGITAEKIASIEAIPTVIEEGKVIFHKAKEGGVERIVVCAPIKIGEADYYMGVMLQRDAQTQYLYLHNVAIEKEAPIASETHRLTTGVTESDSRLFITSILQKAITVKLNKEKISEDFENKRFSHKSDELDKSYLDAVERNDTKTMQNMVEEAAHKAGYTDKLYHGTKQFGFTEFDPAFSDDKISIFVAGTDELAQTYSGRRGVKKLSDVANIDTLSIGDIVKRLSSEVSVSYDGEELQLEYEIMSLEDVNKLINEVNTGIEELQKTVEEKYKALLSKDAASYTNADAGIEQRLLTLHTILENYQYEKMSTPIYMLLHYTDVFSDRGSEIADLEYKIRLMNKLRQVDTGDGVVVKKELGGYGVSVLSYDETRLELKDRLTEGNYALYGNPKNQLVIDCKGKLWNNITDWTSAVYYTRENTTLEKKGEYWRLYDKAGNEVFHGRIAINSDNESRATDEMHVISLQKANNNIDIRSEYMRTTRDIARFAKEHGYESVKFENVVDNGGMGKSTGVGTVYAYFEPNNLKSADPVTYDSAGKVIPLSERFNPEKTDIRYSHKSGDIDNYTEKMYNDYGWAHLNCIMESGRWSDFTSKFASAVSGNANFEKNKQGEYMIPINDVGDEIFDGVNNTIVFCKGTIKNPIITSVLEISEYNETTLCEIRRHVYAIERVGFRQETCGIFTRYTRFNFPNYDTFKRNTVQNAGHNNGLGAYRGGSSGATQGALSGVGKYPFNPVVDTFTDLQGKRRNVRRFGKVYMVEDTKKTKPFYSTPDEAIEAENESLKRRYARKNGKTLSWVNERLAENGNFLKNKRFSHKDTEGREALIEAFSLLAKTEAERLVVDKYRRELSNIEAKIEERAGLQDKLDSLKGKPGKAQERTELNARINSLTDYITRHDGKLLGLRDAAPFRDVMTRYAELSFERGADRKEREVRMSRGEYKRFLADYTHTRVYSKSGAERALDKIQGFEAVRGKLRDELVDELWEKLNAIESPSDEKGIYIFLREKIVEAIETETVIENPEYQNAEERLAYFKNYVGHLSFSEDIREEIRHKYDVDGSRSFFGRWGNKRRGETGVPADVFVTDFARENPGYEYLEDMAVADALFEINSVYEKAKAVPREISAYDNASDDEIRALRSEVTDVLTEFMKKGGRRSKAARNEELASSLYFKERLNEVMAINRAKIRLDQISQKLRDRKYGRFENITEIKGTALAGLLRDLAAFNWRGTISVNNIREKVAKLLDWYAKDNPTLEYVDEDNTGYYRTDVREQLELLADGKHTLKAFEYDMLYNVLSYFDNFIDSYDKVWKNGKWIDAKEEAKRFIDIIDDNRQYEVGAVDKLIKNGYYETFGDPETLVRGIDYYEEGFYTTMLEYLRRTSIDAQTAELNMLEEYNTFLEENPHYLERADTETVEYRGHDIPRLQLISLFMTLKRKHSNAGFVLSGFKYTALDGKTSVRVSPMSTDTDLGQSEIEAIATEERDRIAQKLTEEDRQYIAILEEVYNNRARELKRQRDMQRLGYSNVSDDYYYPIKRSDSARSIDTNEMQAELDRVSSASFNKDIVKGARHKLQIESADSMFRRHVRVVCQYAYIQEAIDYYDKVFHVTVNDNKNDPKSIATETENLWAHGNEYFAALISHIQGVTPKTRDGMAILNKVRSGFAKYQLGANPKVWLTQLSSVIGASSMLDWAAIASAVKIKSDDVDKYCSLARLRNEDNAAYMAQGVFDRTTAAGKAEGVIARAGDVLMVPIGKMDRAVVRHLFAACQAQIERDGVAPVGTEENKVAAGELLERVILRTQQNALSTEKSSAMRSTNEILRTLTMFSADSMKIFGRLLDAFGEWRVMRAKAAHTTGEARTRYLERASAAGRRVLRALGSVVGSSVFMVLIGMLFKWLRAKEDEITPEAVIADGFGNLLGGLPGLRDVYSILVNGYDLENFSYSAFNDVFQSVRSITTNVSRLVTGERELGDVMRSIKSLLYSVGQVTGIPVRNFYNYIHDLIKRVFPDAAEAIDEFFGY